MKKIIEIAALSNGAHRNQTGHLNTVPDGWAEIPDDITVPDTFPFVNIEVAEETRYNEVRVYNEKNEEYEPEKIPYTVNIVTSMSAGVVPDAEPVTEARTDELTVDEMAGAILEGVNEI